MMNEDQAKFRQVTNLFYNAKYQEGRTLIDQLVKTYSSNSSLYVNRALFYSQLGEDLKAMQDLEKAIQLNPFSYIAYFNLFSVLTRSNRDQQAFDNLCCSLSCMYLLKARLSKNVIYAQKSLEYASNNQAARLLKDFLMLDKRQNEKLAAPEDQDISMLQDRAFQMRKYKNIGQLVRLNSKLRLRCSSFVVPETNLQKNILQKVKEFNNLYFELTDILGAVTEKVPRQLSHITKNFDTLMRQKSSESSSNKQSYIQLLVNDDYFKDYKGSDINMRDLQGNNPQASTNIHQIQSKQQVIHYNYSICDSLTHKLKVESVIEEKSMQYDEDQRNQERQSPFNSFANSQINTLSGKKFLKIKILSFMYLQASKMELKKHYCVIQYNKVIQRSKNVNCQDQTCFWNEEYKPIQIQFKDSILALKVYCKEFNSLSDQLIGQAKFTIEVADLVKLPIYNKEAWPIGKVLLHLRYIDKQAQIQ